LDNTVDVTDCPVGQGDMSELTPVEFEPDRVQAQIVIGVRVGGKKVQEIPLTVAFCYPFDLAGLLPQACEAAQKQWEAQQGG